MSRKPDADGIASFMSDLARSLRLDARRELWPLHAYRFDDIQSIAGILRDRALYSRERCAALGKLQIDAADQEIIQRTGELHAFARLFFRPLTPTQYRMEGILSNDLLAKFRAHCPIPAFLLFDGPMLLGDEGTVFTNGTPTRSWGVEKGDSVAFLRTIPFADVYHDDYLPGDQVDKERIKFHRQAEILTPVELGLDRLTAVVCRTAAERDTLIHLLGVDADDWRRMIRVVKPGEALFYGYRSPQRTFVESVTLVDSVLHFQMASNGHVHSGHLRATDPESGELLAEHINTAASFPTRWNVRLRTQASRVLVQFDINGNLAFRAVVSQISVLS